MIRPYEPADLARMREVCLLTGAAGGDATGRWSNDALLPDLFVEPYVTFAPGWAWVVELPGPDDARIHGYLVAVSDTRAFVSWWADTWTPWFAAGYTHPEPPYSEEDELVLRGFEPAGMEIEELADYPAHFHLDLLPEAQGQGWGRKLVGRLRSELADVGVPGLFAALDAENVAARGFYERIGFRELPSSSPGGPLYGVETRPERMGGDDS
ncbi:MAG TPA: GNAT family N-acetyltransferase [Pseudolysinimonas sp.]